MTQTAHFVRLQCIHDDCKNVFRVQLDYKDDIKPSCIDSATLTALAVFRDKFFVQCPKCMRRECRILEGMASVEIEKR